FTESLISSLISLIRVFIEASWPAYPHHAVFPVLNSAYYSVALNALESASATPAACVLRRLPSASRASFRAHVASSFPYCSQPTDPSTRSRVEYAPRLRSGRRILRRSIQGLDRYIRLYSYFQYGRTRASVEVAFRAPASYCVEARQAVGFPI